MDSKIYSINTTNGCIFIITADVLRYFGDIVPFGYLFENKLRVHLDSNKRVSKIHLFIDQRMLNQIEFILNKLSKFLISSGYNRKVDIVIHFIFRSLFKEFKIHLLNKFKDIHYDLIIDETKICYFKRSDNSYHKISLGNVTGITVDIIDTKQMIEERIK